MFSGPAATPARSRRQSTALATRRSQSRAASVNPLASPPHSPAPRVPSPLASRLPPAHKDSAVDHAKLFLNSQTHSVSAWNTKLPDEVKQLLQQSDPYSNPARAWLDHDTGYAALVSSEYCLVWDFVRTASQHSPTCLIFPIPSHQSLSLTATMFSPLPFAAFVANSTTKEPALLIVTPLGQVLLWTSINMGLSGVDKYQAVAIPLSQGEVVRALHKVHEDTYIVATSGSRLFKVRISLASGRFAATIEAFSRQSGVLLKVTSLFGSAIDARSGIVAVAVQNAADSKHAFALTEGTLQCWRMTANRETLLTEVPLTEAVVNLLTDNEISTPNAAEKLDIKFLDLEVAESNDVYILVSFLTGSEHSTSSRRIASSDRSYALIKVDVSTLPSPPSSVFAELLEYSAILDPLPLSAPRLQINRNGDTAFVIFPSVVVIKSFGNHAFEDTIFIKDAAQNRIYGCGIPHIAPRSTVNAAVSALCGCCGIVSIETKKITRRMMSAEERDTADLQSKIEQSVYFGDNPNSPLAFQLVGSKEGNTIKAAEDISKQILASASTNLPDIFDLRTQIADRCNRLKALMLYIQHNGLIQHLSKTSKRILQWDAEKLAASLALWHHQNSKMNSEEHSILRDAIAESVGANGMEEDYVRGFFRNQVDKLPLVLAQLGVVGQQQFSTSSNLTKHSTIVVQLNQLVITVFKTVLRFRQESSALYDIDSQICLAEPWSSRSDMIELIKFCFETTDALLHARAIEYGAAINGDRQGEKARPTLRSQDREDIESARNIQAELKTHLCDLAEYLLTVGHERLVYLQSIESEGKSVTGLRKTAEAYQATRPQVVNSLVNHGRSNHAYDLAERFLDFASLVKLCNDESTGSDARIQFFMERYQQDFAYALFQFYIDNDLLKTLVEQGEKHPDLLTEFLQANPHPDIAWIHQTATQDFVGAAQTLLEQSHQEVRLAEHKLMLSIAKLSQISTCSNSADFSSEPVQRAIESIDDRLDLVQAHVRLLEAFSQRLEPVHQIRSNSEKAVIITRKVAEDLQTTPALETLYTRLVQKLLDGAALSCEDLIDLYTLKINQDAAIADFAFAIDIYVREKNLPTERAKLILQALWRRIYINDVWPEILAATASHSDEGVENLLRATTIYRTLARGIAEEHVLTPAASMFDDTPAAAQAIQSRFSDLSPGEIEDLKDAYDGENQILQRYTDDAQLDRMVGEIRRLISVELANANQNQEDYSQEAQQDGNEDDEQMEMSYA